VIQPYPITGLLFDTFALERRAETPVLDSKKKLLNYTQTWSTVATLYGRSRSIIGGWPRYKTNPNDTDVFYCDYREDVLVGDRLTDANGRSIYVNNIKAPGQHHLELHCFELPDTIIYQSYSAAQDAIGGETASTFSTALDEIAARIDVHSDVPGVAADVLGQHIIYDVTVHTTTLIQMTGHILLDQAGYTQTLKIRTIHQPDINSPWMIIEVEDI
jgi:hypothetical protein